MFNDVKIRGRNAEPWVGKRASKLTMAGRSPVSDFKISSGEIVEIQAPDCSPMFTKVIDVGGPEIPRFPTMSGPPSPGRKALTVTFARGDFLPPRPAWSATQRKISNDFCPVNAGCRWSRNDHRTVAGMSTRCPHAYLDALLD